MTKAAPAIARRCCVAGNAGFSDAPCCPGPSPLPPLHRRCSIQIQRLINLVPLKLLMHGLTPQDNGVLARGKSLTSRLIG